MKSGSQELHEHLMTLTLGNEFTCHDLMDYTGFSQGIVTGFLARAQKTGMVEPVMRQKVKGQRGRTVYKLVSHVEWNHKPKSRGSVKGRHMHKTGHQGMLPLSDNIIEVEHNSPLHIHTHDYGRVEPSYPTPESFAKASAIMDGISSTNPISVRLVDIAMEVEALENKSLKDYSTDDLINEIKRRMK